MIGRLYRGLHFAGIVVGGKVGVVKQKASTMVRAGKKMKTDRRATAKSERDGRFMMVAASNE